MEAKNVPLPTGTGIISVFRGMSLRWKQMMAEWADNSFGAGARNITFRKAGPILEIIDDGRGCDDLMRMESLAQSIPSADNKASMYGIGGVKSQINASQAGSVEVTSTTAAKRSSIVIDWGACLQADQLCAKEFRELPALRGAKTGTVIKIRLGKRLHDIPAIAEDLGYLYAGELKSGKVITIDIDGEVTQVRPYSPPPFERKVVFAFNYNGHAIRGRCGLVKPGIPNPYPGWSFHWGYRILQRCAKPAAGRSSTRIYGEVYLPETWRNVNITKDDFIEDDDGLFEAIAERCRDVVEAGEAQAREFRLNSAAQGAGEALSQAIMGRRRVKVARPGPRGVKPGTVIPTGTGSPHRNGAVLQDGDAFEVDDAILRRAAARIKVDFDDTLKTVFNIDYSGTREKVLLLTLNDSIPRVAALRGDEVNLATFCVPILAHEISDRNERCQDLFPSFKEIEYQAICSTLLARLEVPASSEVAARTVG